MRTKLMMAAAPAIAGMALSGVTAAPASAAPMNAPSAVTGTGSCSDGMTYSFVATGNNGKGQSWSPAFLTATDGSRALFIPASLDITFTAPDGTVFPSEPVMKHSGAGPVSCDIVGHPVAFPTATLTGTVTGTIVATGP